MQYVPNSTTIKVVALDEPVVEPIVEPSIEQVAEPIIEPVAEPHKIKPKAKIQP